MQAWLDDLATYLDRLEEASAELDAAVQTTRSLTRDGAFASLHEATAGLQDGLLALEHLIEQRRALLERSDAPAKAFSLREALSVLITESLYESEGLELLRRCADLGKTIDQVREDALALFVCQFHLADTTSHFLRLILPNDDLPDNYRHPARVHQGGGLLDQAG